MVRMIDLIDVCVCVLSGADCAPQVRRNIHALGGDPENVFIFGESAGAGSGD